MKKLIILLFKIILIAASISACSYPAAEDQPEPTPEALQTQQPQENTEVVRLTAQQAKGRIDSEEGIIIVDVRTQAEYDDAHIPGAILLPVDAIPADAESVIPDKEAVYFIYCRSGNRSATAAALLAEMGYQNIYDFGGIIDWPYELVGSSG